jgi:hypothetical protein
MAATRFTLIFSTVASITLLSGGASVWLASQPPVSAQQDRILETSTSTWLTGTGAIFGLLGGRGSGMTRDDEDNGDDDNDDED